MTAIINGHILIGTGEVIEKGTVLYDGGKITAVGADVTVPEGAQVIDAAGKTVTPGFIDAHSHISVFGNPQTPGTQGDGNESTDPITPYLRGIDSFNPFDIAIGIVRSAGFTSCYTGPGSANVCGGTGFAFKLREVDNVLDMMIPGTEMMKFALGENPKRVYGGNKKMPLTRMAVAALWRETLTKAKTYSDKLLAAENGDGKMPDPDFRLAALVPVVRGEMRARIHCHRADDIVTAVRVSEEFGLKYSLEHVTEGYKVQSFLKERDPDMVIGPLTMGMSKPEIWNCRLDTPAVMEQAGFTRFSIMEDSWAETKYLPMHVGLCIARGLSRDMALKSVTLNPATMLGISDKVGSLEVGKDADIVIWSGDPFSNLTLCEKTIIDGKVFENKPW